MTTADPCDLDWIKFDSLEELIDLSELSLEEQVIEHYPERKEIATQTQTEEEGTIEALEINREATEVTL